MKPPDIDNAVQTAPPIINAATIPASPFKPTETKMIEEMISVINVIPETGFVPTIAIAFAATVVNKNEMISTINKPIKAYVMLFTTPKRKKKKIKTAVITIPPTMTIIGKSFCVRNVSFALFTPPKISFAARENAEEIILEERMMPIIPAIAIPPIPMWRT